MDLDTATGWVDTFVAHDLKVSLVIVDAGYHVKVHHNIGDSVMRNYNACDSFFCGYILGQQSIEDKLMCSEGISQESRIEIFAELTGGDLEGKEWDVEGNQIR